MKLSANHGIEGKEAGHSVLSHFIALWRLASADDAEPGTL
jgi:hypothetical protein